MKPAWVARSALPESSASGVAKRQLAARHSRNAGDRAEEAASLQGLLGTIIRGPMPVDDALLRLEDFRPGAELNRSLEVALLATRAQLEAMRGQFDAARAVIAEAMISAQERRLVVLLDTRIRPAAGYVELLAGDFDSAEREFRQACDGMERVGELGYLSSQAPYLIDALLELGRDDEAFELTDRWQVDRLTVPEDADAQAAWRRVRAKVLAGRGEFDDAERIGREAVAIASATDYLDARATALGDLAEVLRVMGRLEEAVTASNEAIRLYEAKGNVVAAGRLRALLAESRVDAGSTG